MRVCIAVRVRTMLPLLLALGLGCQQAPAPSEANQPSPTTETVEAVQPRSPKNEEATAPRRAPRAGEQITIPAGVVLAGTRPGTKNRRPSREADLSPVSLPSFRIDRLPYPNDPNKPFTTGVTRAQAAALCETDGKRLCTELEWERACDGGDDAPAERTWLTGDRFDADACRKDPVSCQSPFEVAALGTLFHEWTSSNASAGVGSEIYSAITRGGRPSDDPSEHRCGARHALAPSESNAVLGFRCCEGPEPESEYPAHGHGTGFEALDLDEETARAELRKLPELAELADDFHFFTPQQMHAALRRGGRSQAELGFLLARKGLRWRPASGEEVWIFAGAIGADSAEASDEGAKTGLIAAVYPLAKREDGRPLVHAATMLLEGETTSIALAYNPETPEQVVWTTCWGCRGDGGVITLSEEGQVQLGYQ